MKQGCIVAIVAILLSAGSTSAQNRPVPNATEALARYEQFHKLYGEKRRLGVNLAAVDPLRLQGEAAFKTGDVRALLDIVGHATALLQGKQWDEKERFLASLTLEPDRLVVEPNQDLRVLLVRMFPTNVDQVLGASPTVTFELRPDDPAAGETAASAATQVASRQTKPIVIGEGLVISEEMTFATRRVRLADGLYWVAARIEAGGQSIAEITRPIFAISDFTDRVSRLASLVSVIRNSADPKVKAVAIHVSTPEFQLQRLAVLNKARGDQEINAAVELDRIEEVLASLAKGVNPLAQERGELERAYQAADGSPIPYRVYVPLSYDGSSPRPLVVLLHGAFGDERSYFSGLFDPVVIKGESERRGVILAAVNGGGRLATYRGPGQEDALEVIKAVTRDYKIDSARVYLSGHSNGAAGVWTIASNRPDLFAAISPVSGGAPVAAEALGALLEKLKGMPTLLIHGVKDQIAPVENSRKVFAAAQKTGVKAEYIEMPDADHISVVGATFPALMQFFDRNTKKTKP